MEALEDAFGNGFEDYDAVRTDPDLEPVRQAQGAQLELMLLKYSGPLGALARKQKAVKAKSDTNKPWLQW